MAIDYLPPSGDSGLSNASSGSFNTNKYVSGTNEMYLTFAWSRKSQDAANNQTVIQWALRGATGYGDTSVDIADIRVTIAGEVVY